MLLSRRVGVVGAVADAEDAPAADAPDVDVPAADAPAADAPCQAACQPLVTQDVVLAATKCHSNSCELWVRARNLKNLQ